MPAPIVGVHDNQQYLNKVVTRCAARDAKLRYLLIPSPLSRMACSEMVTQARKLLVKASSLGVWIDQAGRLSRARMRAEWLRQLLPEKARPGMKRSA
jgi:hypothetical protein